MIDQEHFTQMWILAWNTLCSVVKAPVGELSLSKCLECLSLRTKLFYHIHQYERSMLV